MDLLASEYGWTADYIKTSVYPDEFMVLLRKIGARRVDEWLIELQIASNPHTEDPKKFVEALLADRRRYRGIEDLPGKLTKSQKEQLKVSLKDLKTSKRIKVTAK